MIVLNEDSIKIVMWDGFNVPTSIKYYVTFSYTDSGKILSSKIRVRLYKTNTAKQTKQRCISAINSKLGI